MKSDLLAIRRACVHARPLTILYGLLTLYAFEPRMQSEKRCWRTTDREMTNGC